MKLSVSEPEADCSISPASTVEQTSTPSQHDEESLDSTNPIGIVLSKKKKRGTPRKGVKRTVLTPSLESAVSGLVAGGVPNRRIAKLYGISPDTVGKIARKPENAEFIAAVRESIRSYSLANIMHNQEDLWGWLSEVVANRDSKAFDAITRGLAALEKIGSSASGESRKIEGSYVVKTEDAKQEAAQLLEALFSEAIAK